MPYARAYLTEDGIDEGARSVTALVSSKNLQSDGLAIVEWDLERYRKTPVVLWRHGYGDGEGLPIGRGEVEETDNGLVGTTYFAPVDVNPLAERVWQAYRQRYLWGFSVGFENVVPVDTADVTRVRARLVEFSAVPVPMDPDAVKKEEAGAFVREWIEEALAKTQSREDERATWTAAFINSLPDAAFAVIEGGGEKDDEGKTVPRSKRHFPHHGKNVKSGGENGSVDLPHLRNALARLDQAKISSALKGRARSHLERHAKALLSSWKNKKGGEIELVRGTEAEIEARAGLRDALVRAAQLEDGVIREKTQELLRAEARALLEPSEVRMITRLLGIVESHRRDAIITAKCREAEDILRTR